MAGCTSIPQYFFQNGRSLLSVVIPDTVTDVYERAFYACYYITNLHIPDSVKTLSTGAFSDCRAFENDIILNNVQQIPTHAFSYCEKVKKVILGSQIQRIAGWAFGGCNSLESFTIKTEIPPPLEAYSFYGVPNACAIYVPAASVEAYKAATNWSARADYIFPIEE